MKIAISQLNTHARKFSLTFERMLAQAEAASSQEADLLVFGLPVLGGTSLGELIYSEEALAELMELFANFARKTPVDCLVPMVMGSPLEDWDLVHVHDGIAESLRTLSMSASSDATEIAEGAALRVHAGGLDFIVLANLGALSQVVRLRERADAVLYLSPYGVNTNDEMSSLAPSISDGCFVEEASSLGMWLVGVGGLGGYVDQVFAGGSFVMAPWGELACVMPNFEEALCCAVLDPLSEGPLSEPVSAPSYNRIEVLWNALVLSTRDYLTKDGISDAALVLEGDLASSTLAALLVDALGQTHVHAYLAHEMQAQAQESAEELVRKLRLVPCTLDEKTTGLPGMSHSENSVGDAQPIYAEASYAACRILAKREGWAYLSAQDKTGFALEADELIAQGALFAPFGDVWRTDLAALARYRNTVAPAIPLPALEHFRVPGGKEGSLVWSGLLEGTSQGPEALLNAIDAILLLHVERGIGKDGIVQAQHASGLVEAVLQRFQALEIYRRACCVYPVLSDRTLNERDWSGTGALSNPVSPQSQRAHGAEQASAQELDSEFQDMSQGLPQELINHLRETFAIEDGGSIEEHISDVMNLLLEIGMGNQDTEDFFSGGLFSKN